MAFGWFVAGMVLLVLAVIAIAVLLFVFWIWMLIDCAKRAFKNDNEKVVWIIVIALLGFIGAAVYYFAVKINDGKINKKK
ncbi:PLDc N-terminal domain-containing protein [Candidatus Woesearchaeota archaeon]|nr:PLDc N-terminal domain-containing protein [Candidatus Woesearchaeota archaeon]